MTAPTPPWMFRSLAAALLAVCVGLAGLPGCGPTAPKGDKKDDKKDDKKPDPAPGGTPNPGPNPNPDVPPKSTLGEVEPAANKAAETFILALNMGTADPEALSAGFLKAVGKPLVFPSEKEKGFSTGAAASWLRKVGDGVSVNLPLLRKQAGDLVYIHGSISGPRLGKDAARTGSYSLRLLREGGAWKVDWLSLSSVEGTTSPAPTPEAAAQGFAVAAFVELVADLDGMPREERAAVLAAALTPALRGAWAAPFDQDKTQGYDYNPGKLGTEAVKVGGGTTGFTAARVGDLPEFKVELARPGGKKTVAVKLVKGPAPNEWLVSEVTEVPAKG